MQHSDIIVHVRVDSISCYWSTSGKSRSIITKTTFLILDNIKGIEDAGEPLVIETAGGTIGDTSQIVSTSSVFVRNEETVLFLTKNPLQIVGGTEGNFPVYNGNVYVNDQPIHSVAFVRMLKEAAIAGQDLAPMLKQIEPQPFSENKTIQGHLLKSGQVTIDTTVYAVDGKITNFLGGVDTNADGYYETLSFNISINGDAVPGPDTVCYKILCPTTGQEWFSTNYFRIEGIDTTSVSFSFDETIFAGHFTGNTDLYFTVEMWNQGKDTLLATDTNIENQPIKIGVPIPPEVIITSITPDKASAGTNSDVTIRGSHFGAAKGTGEVEFFYRSGFPRIPANIVSWTDTLIVCDVPIGAVYGYPGSASSGPVAVKSDLGKISNGYPFQITFSYGGLKWASNSTPFYVNENLPGLSGEGQAIRDAADTWNNVNANFRFVYAGTHSNTEPTKNSMNEILWGQLTTSALAEATMWTANNNIIECDIKFNELITWTTTPGNPVSSVDLQSVTTHEMGHWLNLRDIYGNYNSEYDQQKMMYGISNPDQSKRNLHTDDIDGIYWIYGRLATYTISGYVKTAASDPVQNVVMNGLPGSPQTNAAGIYTAIVPTGWTGTVTPGKTSYVFTPVSRTHTNVTSDLASQNFTATPLGSDATLSDIRVNGTTVPGFSPNQLSYIYPLPFGTTVVPTVAATTADVHATRTIVQAPALPGIATIQVTAENGTTHISYTVSFTLGPASSDAALSDLKVAGTTVTGFGTDILTYNLVLPHNTVTVPVVTATNRFAGATFVVHPAASLPGSTTVVTTAQDGTTHRTYTVNFSLAKNDDSSLSSLFIDGTTVPGFVKTILIYNYALPTGTTVVPTVTAITTDPNATRVITPAPGLPGGTTIRVTAENGTTTTTYTVNFSLSPASTNANLSDIKVNGSTISGFDTSVTFYEIVLPYGTTTIPAVSATAQNSHASIAYFPAAALPGITTIVVTAQDGTTKKTYSISFRLARNSDATLAGLWASGVSVPGFASTILDYIVQVPYGTVLVPTVTAQTTDPLATRIITATVAIPGSTRIQVTAEDGVTKKTYTVNFTVASPSTDATLSNLSVNGQTVNGFNPLTTIYEILLAHGSIAVPLVTATPAHTGATVVVTPASSLPGTTLVVVTAQDGQTKKAYLLNFTVAKNSNAALSDLKVGGNTISGFSPDILGYEYVVSAGATEAPNITARAADDRAAVMLSPATAIPGTTKVTVIAEDAVTTRIYEVMIRYPYDGTNEQFKPDYFLVYPNPGHGIFTLEYASADNQPKVLSILDLTGRLLEEHQISQTDNRFTLLINMESRPAGTYFIRLISHSGVSYIKLIKD